MKKNHRTFDLEFKKRIVDEFLEGKLTAQELADREGIETAHIYYWKSTVGRVKQSPSAVPVTEQNSSAEQAKRIRDLEEELDEYKKKNAELSLHNDLLKKLHPNYLSLRNANGFAEIKKLLERSKGHAK